MKQLTLSEIKAEIDRLAALIGAAGYVLPTYGHSEDFARPHIEVDSRGFHYVVVERGEERQRFTTGDLAELLFLVFSSVTFSLACDYEVENRIKDEDFRRQLFRRQIELLSMLSPNWAEREAHRHREILRENPFDDLVDARIDFMKKLQEQGQPTQDSWRKACERYPLPPKR